MHWHTTRVARGGRCARARASDAPAVQLHQQVRERGASGTPVVLLIDGLDAVRRTLDDVETAVEFDALDEVLADGDHAGITIVATVEQAAAVPTAFLARCPRRWRERTSTTPTTRRCWAWPARPYPASCPDAWSTRPAD